MALVIVCGHYGAGKTNLALNLAFDAAACGRAATVVDLDVVNPYFRSSEYAAELEARGVRLVAPVFAERGGNLDVPSLTGAVAPAIESAHANEDSLVIIDAGGDDVGATALGRFARAVQAGDYRMLYVVNRSRNLTARAHDAVEVLREIEKKARLSATHVVNNTHLQAETDERVVRAGIPFAQEASQLAGLPLAFTTVPAAQAEALAASLELPLFDRKSPLAERVGEAAPLYPVRIYVRAPWEN